MTPTNGPKRLKDLVTVLDGLEALHRRLLNLVREKTESMRRNNIDVLQRITSKEQETVLAIEERDGFRRQLVATIGVELGLSSPAGRSLRASRIAPHMPVALRQQFQESVRRLGEIVTALRNANAVATAIAAGVLNHLGHALATIKPSLEQPVGYSHEGVVVARWDTRIVDAIG